MKLAKALKLKNKLASEIGKLKERINANNSYVEGAKQYYDVTKLLLELFEKIEKLIGLKLAINKANQPIQQNIFELSETKALVSFFEKLNVQEGEVNVSGYGGSPIMKQKLTYVNESQKETYIETYKKKIEELQEEMDTYNYTAEIDFSE